jgi:hypothetical protein
MSINYFRKYPKKMLNVLNNIDTRLDLKKEEGDFKFIKDDVAMNELKSILHDFKSVP